MIIDELEATGRSGTEVGSGSASADRILRERNLQPGFMSFGLNKRHHI